MGKSIRRLPSTRKSSDRKVSSRAKPVKKTLVSSATKAVDFTADVVQEIANALATITGGIFDGANVIVDTAGSVTDRFGEMFNVYATQIFKGAGDGAKYVANQMGVVLRKIPTVGGGMAYVVESVGGAVYHVIVAVGSLGGSSVKRVGKVLHKASDLVVYTLTVGNEQVGDSRNAVNGLVDKFAKNISGR